jgi:hypothetical protein
LIGLVFNKRSFVSLARILIILYTGLKDDFLLYLIIKKIKKMTLVINKKLSVKEIKSSLDKLVKKTKSVGLRKHFGLSDEKIDALEFQKKARNEWS